MKTLLRSSFLVLFGLCGSAVAAQVGHGPLAIANTSASLVSHMPLPDPNSPYPPLVAVHVSHMPLPDPNSPYPPLLPVQGISMASSATVGSR